MTQEPVSSRIMQRCSRNLYLLIRYSTIIPLFLNLSISKSLQKINFCLDFHCNMRVKCPYAVGSSSVQARCVSSRLVQRFHKRKKHLSTLKCFSLLYRQTVRVFESLYYRLTGTAARTLHMRGNPQTERPPFQTQTTHAAGKFCRYPHCAYLPECAAWTRV